MKNIMKLAVITTLMAIGIATANAQTTTTNIVLNLNIALSGFMQSDESNAAPVRIGNKEILLAFGTSEGGHTVDKSGKLIVVSPAEDSGGPTFFIREKNGTNITDTSLSLLMTVSESDPVIGAKGVSYRIITLNFDNGVGTDFSVSGFATFHQGKASGKGVGSISDVTTSVQATVSGTGHINGEYAILKGNVNASGPKAEIAEVP
jgi:hypothetical protein